MFTTTRYATPRCYITYATQLDMLAMLLLIAVYAAGSPLRSLIFSLLRCHDILLIFFIDAFQMPPLALILLRARDKHARQHSTSHRPLRISPIVDNVIPLLSYHRRLLITPPCHAAACLLLILFFTCLRYFCHIIDRRHLLLSLLFSLLHAALRAFFTIDVFYAI